MKALVISEDDNFLSQIDEILKKNNIDSIKYKWFIKALDNIEEISPDIIIANACDYPRHWKMLGNFVELNIPKNVKIYLYVPENFSLEEQKKAEQLKIQFCFKDICQMQNILSTNTPSIANKSKGSLLKRIQALS